MLDNSLSWGKTLLCNNFLSEGTDRQAGAGTVSDATESLQMFLCVAFFSTEEMAVYPEEMDKLSMVIPYIVSLRTRGGVRGDFWGPNSSFYYQDYWLQ